MEPIKNQELPTILSPNKQSYDLATLLSNDTRGFTLIEILLVLAIIVTVLSYGLPVMSRITGQNINTSARNFISLVRGMRSDAILLNTLYRLSIDLENNTYIVETQNNQELLKESDVLSKKADSKKGAPEQEEKPAFSPSDKYFKKPKALPSGVVFNGVLKEKEGLIKDGTVYIYFFPNGLNERAIIYLNSRGATTGGFSIIIHPTAGKVDFIKQKVAGF